MRYSSRQGFSALPFLLYDDDQMRNKALADNAEHGNGFQIVMPAGQGISTCGDGK
jgi:hypothetical protein